jgi:Ca2+-binding RTX toxin-like protein
LNNRITGNVGNNNLSGLNGNDSIFGGQGNDTLKGGSGNDTMFGNEGDDAYIVFDALDVASEATNGITDEGGTDTVEAFVSYSLNGTDGRQFIENPTLTTGGNAVDGTGNGLDNIITGNEAGNRLEGLGGNDTLLGGIGNDTLIGGAGLDRLFAGANDDDFGVITSEGAVEGSQDSIDGGTGIDSVEFASGAGVNAGVDLVFGEYSLDGFGTFGTISGIERVTTGSGDDGVVGNLDTTFVDLGAGSDTVALATLTTTARGGEGDDTLTLLSLGSAVTFNLSTATLQTGFENLFLTTFDDTGTGTEAGNLLAGGSGNDTLFGLGGADRLFGGFYNDELYGGAGNDTLDGGTGFDRLFGGADEDDFGVISSQELVSDDDDIDGGTGIDSVAFDSGAGVDVDLQVGFYSFLGSSTTGSITGVERVTTGSRNDIITSGPDTASIDAGGGDDIVLLFDRTITMTGGTGVDTLDLQSVAGAQIINLATDALLTDFENLVLGTGDDSGTGTEGVNDLRGNNGNDTLFGLGGADALRGNDGNDRLFGGADNDALFGNDGSDTLDGGAGVDQLFGGNGNDTITVVDLRDRFVQGDDDIDLLNVALAVGFTLDMETGLATGTGPRPAAAWTGFEN